MDPIRSKALEHLQTAWPTSLRAWDAREDIARLYEYESKDGEMSTRARTARRRVTDIHIL